MQVHYSQCDVLVASGETVVIDGTACVHSVLFHIFPKCTPPPPPPVILVTDYLIEHKIVLDFSKGTIS